MTQNERLPSSGSSQVLAQDVVSNHGVQLAPLADSGVSIRLRLADIRLLRWLCWLWCVLVGGPVSGRWALGRVDVEEW